MIVVLFGFYIVALYLGVRFPTKFVIFYILASTKFLGFLDPSSFIIGGVEIGYFGLNMIAILSILFKPKWYVISEKLKWFVIFIIGTLLFGILKPYFDEHSSIFLAFMASKELWFYFLLLYMLVYRENIDDLLLIKTIKRLGVYLAAIYIVGFVAKEVLPYLYTKDGYVRTFFPTYISLAIFIYAVEIKFYFQRSITKRLVLLGLFLGLFLASHLSLTLMTVLGFLVYIFLYDKKLVINGIQLMRFLLISSLFLTLAFLSSKKLNDKLTENVEGVVSGENTALSTRDLYNAFRWEAINKQKNLGYGYIHQSSDFMQNIQTYGKNRFMERFTVIDSGYVDLLIKYGYLGTGIFLFFMLKFHVRGLFSKYRNPFSVALSIFLLQYLFINYTWSVYTFAHGIIPSVITIYLIYNWHGFMPQNHSIES